MKMDRILNYPRSLHRALQTSLQLGMPPYDVLRYMFAYTKNARCQLGFPEKFYMDRIFSFRTKMGPVYIKDRPVDPGAIAELVGNPYDFSKAEGSGSYVDAGAGTGLAAKIYSFYNPGARVFCFEPVEESAELIAHNVPNAVIRKCALGKEKAQMEFHIDQKNFMAFRDVSAITAILDSEDESKPRKFEVLPLDSFKGEIGDVAMLKIDTEGSEVEILLGASGLLKKTSEVKMETHSAELHAKSKEILSKSGFRIVSESHAGQGCGYVFAKKER